MRSALTSVHSQILYTSLSLWMDLNKRGRTRRKKESKKPEPRHDISIANGIKGEGTKNSQAVPGTIDFGGLFLHLVTLK